ncbi:MAG: pilus assembly protein PilM [Verrucomicrobia bacterium]|jgi:Tfp pilus assembly protein PilN|nr:pilus assembly protein PilM [Verrucomicrobiota bacterium]
MAKDTATGILVTPEVVEWTTLRQSRGRPESAAEGRFVLPPPADLEADAADDSGEAKEPAPFARVKSPVVLALPSTQLLLRILELPAVDDDELAGMVELQVDKFSPFPIDQMVVSHEVLARDANDCTVLVAAAKESAVDVARETLVQEGLRIERVDAALMGRWTSLVASGELAVTGREALVIVTDDTVEMLTHEGGTLVALNCLGTVHDLADPEVAADMAQEVSHLLMGIELERGRATEQQVTLWSDEPLPPFVSALSTACGVTVGERLLGKLPTVSHGAAARSLAGGALLDLTPASWTSAASAKRTRRMMLVSALVVLGLWGVFVGGGLGWIAFERARLHGLEAEAKRWSEPANAVRRLRLQVSLIERYTDRTYSALEILREISQLQPEGTDLTTWTYRKGEGLSIDGEADSGPLVNAFNEQLNQSALFTDVKPGTRTLTRAGRNRFSFDIQFAEATE